jgi:AcrR family transcriptional regulator
MAVVGRPRSFDRDIALDAAMVQFWRWGYDKTSIAMLTEAMGVTPPSLYAAFGDKDRLFEEASSLYFQRICDAVDRAASRPTVREAVGTMLDATARAQTAADTPLGCLVLTEPRLTAQRQVLHSRLMNRIARGVAEGDLPATVHPGPLASFLVAVMHGMSGHARDGGSTDELLAIAGAAVDAIPERRTLA